MVKISIKRDDKSIKPKQKQKQKQSQKVIVNIDSNVAKPKRRRTTGQVLQKIKVVNRQQTTPTQIYVPQALPIQQQQPKDSLNEFIKYFKENETQKETIKEIKKRRIKKLMNLKRIKKKKTNQRF